MSDENDIRHPERRRMLGLLGLGALAAYAGPAILGISEAQAQRRGGSWSRPSRPSRPRQRWRRRDASYRRRISRPSRPSRPYRPYYRW
jgi:hypothetical protein